MDAILKDIYCKPLLSPLLLIFILLLGLTTLYFQYGKLKRRNISQKLFLTIFLLRTVIILMLLLAFINPVITIKKQNSEQGKILVLVDSSSSMDVIDKKDTSRFQRACNIADYIVSSFSGDKRTKTKLLFFDSVLHPPDYKFGRKNFSVLTTDIAGSLKELQNKYDLSDYKACVMLTDGGDDTATPVRKIDIPLFSIGIGSDISKCNNISLENIKYPDKAEVGIAFTIEVAAKATFSEKNGNKFAAEVKNTKLWLEEKIKGTKEWKKLYSGEFSFLPLKPYATEKFTLTPTQKGVHFYRIKIEEKRGELSGLDNLREFSVDVDKKSIHILYASDSITMNYKMLRRELSTDNAIRFTALFPTLLNKMILQTSDKNITDDQKQILQNLFIKTNRLKTKQGNKSRTDKTFNTSAFLNTLNYFDVIILGAVNNFNIDKDRAELLEKYVTAGGAIVFSEPFMHSNSLPSDKIIRTLMPWEIDKSTNLLTGKFILNLDKKGMFCPLIANTELNRLINKTPSVYIESMATHEKLKPAATSIFNAKIGNKIISVMALQSYGSGKTLAFSSNTLWRWAISRNILKKIFSVLWSQTIRYLVSSEEHTPFLSVHWDKTSYKLGDTAQISVKIKKDYSPDISLKAGYSYTGYNTSIQKSYSLSMRKNNSKVEEPFYRTNIKFNKRGIYTLAIKLYNKNMLIDKYIRTLKVSPLPLEGTYLSLKKEFLTEISTKNGYFAESEYKNIISLINNLLKNEKPSASFSLLYSKPFYLILLLLLIMTEWSISYMIKYN